MQKSDIKIYQLTQSTIPDEENLVQMADLIYSTDPYIYPAMFGDMNRAKLLLPELIKKDDVLFGYSHCLVAEYNGTVVGTLLWNKGNFSWKPDLLRELAKERSIEESPWLDYVAKEYTSIYSENREQLVSFYSLCVNPKCRGCGIARMLFEFAIKSHPDCRMKLSVLNGNTNAIHLYQSLGFEIKEKYTGFSISNPRPMALYMQRN